MNQVIQEFLRALTKHFKAIVFLFKHGLWAFLFIPFALNILLFLGGVALVSELSNETLNQVNIWLNSMQWSIDSEGWLFKSLYFIFWISFRVFYFLLFAFIGGYVVLIILSPILSLISYLVEKRINGTNASFNLVQFINEIFRGIAVSLRNFAIEVLSIVLLFLLSFLPIIGLLSPILLFFITAFYYGFSVMDYSLERRGYSISESVKFVRAHRGSVTAIGVPFAAILLIPFLGTFLIGFIAIIATVSGTIEILAIEKKRS